MIAAVTRGGAAFSRLTVGRPRRVRSAHRPPLRRPRTDLSPSGDQTPFEGCGRPAPRRRQRVGSPSGGAGLEASVDVLVVDDDESVRSSICEILGTAGLSTGEAFDGEMALEELARKRVGAMVVDVRMPRLDGLAMLQRLSDPPPTVLVSAYAIGDDVRERLAGKVLTYLQKPFRPEILLRAVAEALGHSEG